MAAAQTITTPVKCIMCGGPGPLTKEHVVANWVGKYTKEPSTHYYHSEGLHGVSEVSRSDHRGDIHDHTLPILCFRCNSIWGAGIHRTSSPLLKRLIDGEVFAFDERQRGLLTRWIYYYALIRQFVHPFLRVTPAPVRAKFLADGTIPRSARFWLIRTVDDGAVLPSFYRSLKMQDRLLYPGPDGFLLALALKNIAVVCFESTRSEYAKKESEYSLALDGAAAELGLLDLRHVGSKGCNLRYALVARKNDIFDLVVALSEKMND